MYPQDETSLVSLEAKNVVPAVAIKKYKIAVPKPPNEIEAVEGHLEGAQAQERCWLEHSIKLRDQETLNKEDIIAWSAYHASLLPI